MGAHAASWTHACSLRCLAAIVWCPPSLIRGCVLIVNQLWVNLKFLSSSKLEEIHKGQASAHSFHPTKAIHLECECAVDWGVRMSQIYLQSTSTQVEVQPVSSPDAIKALFHTKGVVFIAFPQRVWLISHLTALNCCRAQRVNIVHDPVGCRSTDSGHCVRIGGWCCLCCCLPLCSHPLWLWRGSLARGQPRLAVVVHFHLIHHIKTDNQKVITVAWHQCLPQEDSVIEHHRREAGRPSQGHAVMNVRCQHKRRRRWS